MAIPNATKAEFMKGTLNLVGDTINAVLLTSALGAFNIDTMNFYSDIIAAEVAAGGGYAANGQALANKAVTTDTVDDEGVWDADDVTWVTATITARSMALIKWTGVTTTSRIIRHIDFGVDKVSSGGDFVVQYNTEGIINTN
jgi:hypothetical protein